ncbi:MAG: alanine--tRNA ligase, partial [Nitrososphaeria archaeon]|nr:alanine--tRNA ligase [Nitrososphaeria archaeon]NIQ33444.1 alanine--tRNA ligase [Nitrososphaeria archaeon]
ARLDITHYRRLKSDEVMEIEGLSNRVVSRDLKVNTFYMGRAEAERRYGTDIYQGGAVPGAEIRIVESEGWDVEACGGTHCGSTGEVMVIKVLGTDRIQDGVERLTFTSGMMAVKEIQELDTAVRETAKALDTSKDKLVETAEKVRRELASARERMRRLKETYIRYKAESIVRDVKKIRGVKSAIYASEEEEVDDLISIGERVEKLMEDGIYVACSLRKGVNCVIFLGKKLVKRGLSALELARLIGERLDGGGAGDARFARAGGGKTGDLLSIVDEYLRRMVNK